MKELCAIFRPASRCQEQRLYALLTTGQPAATAVGPSKLRREEQARVSFRIGG